MSYENIFCIFLITIMLLMSLANVAAYVFRLQPEAKKYIKFIKPHMSDDISFVRFMAFCAILFFLNYDIGLLVLLSYYVVYILNVLAVDKIARDIAEIKCPVNSERDIN